MSANAASTAPAPPSQSCSSRRPGVSITTPPPGSTISSRCVVVCRPSSSSTRVAFDRHQLAAGEAVDERRLADAARPDQHRGRAGRDAGAQRVAAVAGDAPRRRARGRRPPPPRRPRRAPRVVDAVGLRQHDLRRRAALPDRDEIALDAARLEIRAERADDEREVDVRRQRLRLRRQSRRLPHDRAAPRQHDAGAASREADPVADRDVDALVARAVRAGGRARSRAAVSTSNPPRCAAMTRPGTRPGSRLSASSALHPSAPRSKSGNAKLLRERGTPRVPRRSAGARSGRPRRQQAQSSSVRTSSSPGGRDRRTG